MRERPTPTLPSRMRRFKIFHVVWARVDSGRPKSKRFSTRSGALRFADLLEDESSQGEYGELSHLRVEVAEGYVGRWKAVR